MMGTAAERKTDDIPDRRTHYAFCDTNRSLLESEIEYCSHLSHRSYWVGHAYSGDASGCAQVPMIGI
jgi:hypothetical protein